MARIATHLELVLLICELCGLYAIQPNSPTGMIQRYRPLTTIDRILKFAESLNRTPGTAALRGACQDSFSCSGSPQENKLSIRCAWKRSAGGYGLSIVSLKEELEVGWIVSTSGTSRIRKPDLLFRRPSKEVPAICLDYKGRVHLDQGRPGADDARQNELIAAGMRPYTILSEQYQDMDYMDALIDGTIRRDLGLKTRSVTPERALLERRRREALLAELNVIDGLSWGTSCNNPSVVFAKRRVESALQAERRAREP